MEETIEMVRVKMPKSTRKKLKEISARLGIDQQDAATLIIEEYYQNLFNEILANGGKE